MKRFIIPIYFLFAVSNLFSQSGWVQINTGITFGIYDIHFFDGNTGLALGVNYQLDSSNLIKTTNGGINWIYVTGLSGAFVSMCFTDVNTGYLAGYHLRILKTTNGGNNWTVVSSGSNFWLSTLAFPNSNTGYAAGENSIIKKTTDGGATFFSQPVDTPSNWIETLNKIWFTDPNTGFVIGSSFGSVFRTTNGGRAWHGSQIGVSYYSDIFFFNQNTGYMMGFSSGIVMTFSKTFNNGISWSSNNYNVPVTFESMYFVNLNTGYLIGHPSEVMKTTNGGTNWYFQTIVPSGVFMHRVIFTDANTGFITADGGRIFRTTNGGELVGVKSEGIEIPSEFSLQQNYPNPFNPSTKIKFDIPASLSFGEGPRVRLIIYDILGREIATLVNEQLKPGSYEVEWPATGGGSNYASGIYFYSLQTESFTQTKKLVLLK